MIRITVQLANGDRVEFNAADTVSPWVVKGVPGDSSCPDYAPVGRAQDYLDSVYCEAEKSLR
jgi:hypothetical protein